MTSAYERTTKRTPSVQTLGEEEGRLEVSLTGDLEGMPSFLGGKSRVRNLDSPRFSGGNAGENSMKIAFSK